MDKKNDKKAVRFFETVKLKKRNRDIYLKIFIAFVVAGYFLFFTSKTWLSAYGELTPATDINSVVANSDREIKVMRWEYSEEQQLMEVEIDVFNKALDGLDSYSFSAVERTKGALKVEKVAEDPNFIVVQIYGVESDFKEISLRMEIPSEDKQPVTQKLYTNVKEVNFVDNIETLDLKGYKVARLNNNISIYRNEIALLQKEIDALNEKIVIYNKNIEDLESQKLFQTETEIKDTNELINEALKSIDNNNSKISDINDEIEEYNQKIIKANEQIISIQN